MPELLTNLIVFSGCFAFTSHRLLRYLRYLQQEEYSTRRMLSWFFQNRAFDTKGSAATFICAAISSLTGYNGLISMVGAVTLYGMAYFEEDPRREGKLRLNMTERATRIFYVSLSLYGSLSFAGAILCPDTTLYWLSQFLLIQLTPVWLILSNALLQRDERRRQQNFVNEAKAIFAKCSPYVIGITGSYGKTSTKEALAQILQITLGPTFWPAKGINTVMGNTREIRSGLQKGHRYAIFEMGAYGRGSIEKLCLLTPPNAAIITTIGTAHLERFGSQNNILLAKAELAQAVPADGLLVCNGDDEGARSIACLHQKKTTLLYGFDSSKGHLDCLIDSWSIQPKGTVFTIIWEGIKYAGFTPLFGKDALSNAIGAFTLACALGANPEYALAVIRQLQPVDNRLQVKKDGDTTYLHDAYNSNPVGFATALNVMRALPGDRKILMTPGIIELGPEQHVENEKVGRLAAQVCDVVILVGHTNKAALTAGLTSGGMEMEQITHCDTRDQAFKHLKVIQKSGDVILIENDLPDLYEKINKF